MKKFIIPAFLLSFTCSLLAGGSPGGPWANGAYYSGFLNGKYMGVVTGNNIAGVLGFAIVDGAPPFRSIQQQSAGGGNIGGVVVLNNQNIEVDNTQNYFAIFVEGRTYTGLTTAGVDISAKTVAGALQSTTPAAGTGEGGANSIRFDARDALSIVNRGLSGGFTAKIKCDKAVFTFSGDGELSTPANTQSYQIQTDIQGLPASQTNETVTGIYQTASTSFQVKGIRTSFNSFSPQGAADANTAQAGAGGGAAAP
jgi:hypothetical protein